MNNDIDMVKAIAFRKRIKYAGDIVEQLFCSLKIYRMLKESTIMTYPKMHCWHVKKSKDALVKHGRWREWNNDVVSSLYMFRLQT